MNLYMLIYIGVLFFVLTPGQFITFPQNSDQITLNVSHAIIFAIVYHFTHKIAWKMSTEFNMKISKKV